MINYNPFDSIGNGFEDGPWIQGDYRLVTLRYQRIEDDMLINEFMSQRMLDMDRDMEGVSA